MNLWLALGLASVLWPGSRGAEDLGRTPLCAKCKCVNRTLTDPDVDCSETAIMNHFYDDTNWMDESNRSYAISSVSLQNNNLVELQQEFPASSLVKLDLSHNRLTTLADGVFRNLQALDVLVLSYNQLSVIGVDVFKGNFKDGEDYPLSFKTLELNNNQLHTLNMDLFKHVEKHVEKLLLQHNPFKVIDESTMIAIGSLTYLKELNLSHTQLKDLPQNFFHTPRFLTSVNLSGNRFQGVPKALENSHDLQTLHLNDNPIVNLTTDNGFPELRSLKELHLCNMPELEIIDKGSLSGLMNLKELYVFNNMKLRSIHTDALASKDEKNEIWPPITKLIANNNQLTRLDSHLLVHWDALDDLDLLGNPWTCECENQWMLEELMPVYIRINRTQAELLLCAAPIEMEGKKFYNLSKAGSDMRCLDLYGNRPERDGALLVGMLAGLLVGIPLVLFAIYAYQRRFFGLCDHSPASYSRRFYDRTNDDGF